MKKITEPQRLIVAMIDKDDTDSLFQLNSNRQALRFFPGILNYDENRRMIEKILEQYERHGYCFWKLILNKGASFIGIVGLLHHEIDGSAETEIAYRIRPEYWNCGFATEAALS